LPPYVEKVGPEIFRKDTSNFISKNSKRALLMWVNKEMRVSSLVQRKATTAKDYIKFLLTQQIGSTGITKGLIKDIQGVLQIYTGDERKIRGVIKNAVDEIVTTEHTIFQ
jgi:tRNA nucleotidyltransferase (CCA-adding enzyme)